MIWPSHRNINSLMRFAKFRLVIRIENVSTNITANRVVSTHLKFLSRTQAWFRGIITRNYIRKLHENATVLQRYWRNYRVRIFVKQYLVVCVEQVWKSYYYDTMATRIQAVWRGYWTRKTKINFVELRQWLKNIYTKNEETLRNMKKYVRIYMCMCYLQCFINVCRVLHRFRQKELEYMESLTEQEAMLWILFILFKVIVFICTNHFCFFFLSPRLRYKSIIYLLHNLMYERYVYVVFDVKLHHLLRTKCIPGVITRIDKTRFTHIEEMLKCFDYERYTWRTDSSCKKCQIDRKLSLMFRGTYFEKCEKEIREFERSVQEGKVSIFRSKVDLYIFNRNLCVTMISIY